MLLVLPLILASISAHLSCAWYLAIPDEAAMTPPGYVALLNSRFDLNFPGQGATDTKGLAAPSGKDPEVLGKYYNSFLGVAADPWGSSCHSWTLLSTLAQGRQ